MSCEPRRAGLPRRLRDGVRLVVDPAPDPAGLRQARPVVDGAAREDPAVERQLRAIIDLVRSLGIEEVVAEGVETDRQADVLRDIGCPMVQGWLFGRPATTESVLAATRVEPFPG